MTNVQVFADRYPEMRAISQQNPGFVASVIAENDRQIHASVENREDIVLLSTAADIARSPQGRAAQMLDKTGESAYSRLLKSRFATLGLGDRFL